MMDERREPEGSTRAWHAELYDDDGQFARLVPEVKWSFFAGRVRPLNDVVAAVVWDTLFAGVSKPLGARPGGWVGKLFRHMRPKPAARSGSAVADELASAFGWGDDTAAYLVFSSRQVYAARWADLLECFRRSWIPVDNPCQNLYVCGDGSDHVTMFMEGNGPYLARRMPLPLSVASEDRDLSSDVETIE